MKSKILVLLTAAFVLPGSNINAQEWNIDYSHSSITFSINHFFTPVNGRFEEFEGAFQFNPDNPSESKVNFNVDVASVNTEEEKRDKDLVSDSFFNTKEFPKMKFESTSIERKGDKDFIAHGRLTIKDITKDVEIPFTVLGRGDHPMRKGLELMGLKADFLLNRTEYNVGTGNWAATLVVGDEVRASVVLEVMRKK